MKKLLLVVLMLSLIAGVATVWASVLGTPHDLAPEPCAMCHTPHSGTGSYPLWNRTQTTVSYVMYSSLTFDMGPALLSGPRPPSSLCLVCHNGVASELVNYPGPCSDPDGAYDLQISGCADLGNDLRDDHPISFNYNNGKDQDNNGFPGVVSLGGSTTRVGIPGVQTLNYPLYGTDTTANTNNTWFECATCHSVHNLATYPGQGDYQVYFLRADNNGSAMCLDCHRNR